MKAMESWESDGTSGIFQDELGNPLLVYFTQRHEGSGPPPGGTVYYEPGPKTPSALGRSPTDFAQAKNKGKKVHFDGIQDGGPPGGLTTLSQDSKSFTLHDIEYVYHDSTFMSEATSVIHLVHAWPDQGCSAKKYDCYPSPMTPLCSTNILRPSTVERGQGSNTKQAERQPNQPSRLLWWWNDEDLTLQTWLSKDYEDL
ncbi:hypothetical protein C8R48DRAFT_680275 [Suillus tomentosus]|nr:hypothetical protein C8R48DRAFT_680275 [Suillus tomentosus]